ncbi:MAG: flippase-like domain-containing protein [Gemmatimonadetes bacterium]|nr:flippase-like domain-containing protein [Gemmatimonadota bacterium]
MTGKRVMRHVLQVALLGFVAWYVAHNWAEYQHLFRDAHPDWLLLTVSSGFVLLAYGVLIQTWRQTVVAWGEQISFVDAMRIWFISNLAKNAPGRIWAIAAMGTLAQARGVSPVAAVGSSLVVQLVNVVTGLLVFMIAGSRALQLPWLVVAAIAALGVATLAAPSMLPSMVRLVNRVTKRSVSLPPLPHRAIWWAAAGTALAWVLYGFAFEALAVGLGASAQGASGDWMAIFIGSYLLGFIAVFATAGLGVREIAMAEGLQRTGLAAGGLVALLVAASRVWLTVLEIIPGVVLLLLQPLERRGTSTRP